EWSRLILFTQVIAEFGRAAWSQYNHSVGEVREMVSSIFMTQIAQRFLNGILRLRLSYIDDVVILDDIAEMRMIFFPVGGGDPAVVLVRVAVELAVSEIAAEQTELPHVIRDVFADVADSSIRADDYLLVFLGDSGDPGRRIVVSPDFCQNPIQTLFAI